MKRSETNRRLGPQTSESPLGKHKSNIQTVTYSSTISDPMSDEEYQRMCREWDKMGAITEPFNNSHLLDKYRELAINYLDEKKIPFRDFPGWEWGHSLSKEYTEYFEQDGGFVAAFNILSATDKVKTKIEQGDLEKAISYALHIGLSARKLIQAEMEPLFFAGYTKTNAANTAKSATTQDIKKLAFPIYQKHYKTYLNKHGLPNSSYAASQTSKELLNEHNINRAARTIRGWFKTI